MSKLSWAERKDLLSSLLQTRGDDDEGIALDGVLHGQNTIGKTCKFFSLAVEIERSFLINRSKNHQDRLTAIHRQRSCRTRHLRSRPVWRRLSHYLCLWFPTDFRLQIDVVSCVLDGRVYVRKSIERAFALRSREVSHQ